MVIFSQAYTSNNLSVNYIKLLTTDVSNEKKIERMWCDYKIELVSINQLIVSHYFQLFIVSLFWLYHEYIVYYILVDEPPRTALYCTTIIKYYRLTYDTDIY